MTWNKAPFLVVLAILLGGADDCGRKFTYVGLPAEGKPACAVKADYERSCVVNGQLYTCIREAGEDEFQCAKAVAQ